MGYIEEEEISPWTEQTAKSEAFKNFEGESCRSLATGGKLFGNPFFVVWLSNFWFSVSPRQAFSSIYCILSEPLKCVFLSIWFESEWQLWEITAKRIDEIKLGVYPLRRCHGRHMALSGILIYTVKEQHLHSWQVAHQYTLFLKEMLV